MQKATEKYMAWSKMPFTQAGKRLADDAGKILRPHTGKPKVTDGPYSETKEALGGFYLIEAASYDQAVELRCDQSARGIRRGDRSASRLRDVSDRGGGSETGELLEHLFRHQWPGG